MPSNLTSISFPASPALNDTYTYGNQTYQWNGTEWVVSYDSNSIPIGAVTLSGNQTITGVKTFSNNIVANGGITGNITGNVTGTIQTAEQPNITSLGTLSSLTVNGTITSSNIKITGTASTDINTIDHYSEGTWTPTFGTTTISGGTNRCTYVRVGKLVTCVLDLTNFTSAGTANNLFGGLPFNANSRSGFAILHHAFLTSATPMLFIEAGGKTGQFLQNNASAAWSNANTIIGSNRYIHATITYLTND